MNKIIFNVYSGHADEILSGKRRELHREFAPGTFPEEICIGSTILLYAGDDEFRMILGECTITGWTAIKWPAIEKADIEESYEVIFEISNPIRYRRMKTLSDVGVSPEPREFFEYIAMSMDGGDHLPYRGGDGDLSKRKDTTDP